ncbi:MAG TPA: site-specific integrase, partial [Azospirillum sp.]
KGAIMPAPSRRVRITKTHVDTLREGQVLWDADVPGFAVRRLASATVYIVKYRVRGKQRWFTIGRHGAPWTVQAARDDARRVLGEVASGRDPQASKEASRTATPGMTVAEVFDTFLARHVSQTKIEKEYRSAFQHEALPFWGSWPLEKVSKRDIIRMLDRIVDRGATVRANRVFAYVRRFFNWCVERDLIAASPCAGVKPPTDERKRDRVHSEEEIRLLWLAADRVGWPFGPFLRLLILTAQRLNEVAGMRWSEIHLEQAMWTIPAERAKNGCAHHVPLSPAAAEIIRSLPRLDSSDLVFTTTGRTPISGWTRAKARIDAAVVVLMTEEAMAAGQDATRIKPMADWRFHDIRRSVTTGLAAMGVAPHVADRILNHVQGTISGVAAVYNRHKYLEERQAALVAWAERLKVIVESKARFYCL